MNWRGPKRGDPLRIFETEDSRGFVFQEMGEDEFPYFTAIVDNADLTNRAGDPFLFASLKDAKHAVEEIIETGRWKRPKRRYRAYKTYDPEREGYGNEEQWKAVFQTLFGEGITDDAYGILGLSTGASWGQIKAAYRRLVAVHHPDKGGDNERFLEIRAAFEALRNQQKAA